MTTTKKISKDALVEEILMNARKDREEVMKVRTSLLSGVDNFSDQAGDLGHLTRIDGIARLSEVLTKVNGQLVELAKIQAKNDAPEEEDKNDIFDAIESSE